MIQVYWIALAFDSIKIGRVFFWGNEKLCSVVFLPKDIFDFFGMYEFYWYLCESNHQWSVQLDLNWR